MPGTVNIVLRVHYELEPESVKPAGQRWKDRGGKEDMKKDAGAFICSLLQQK
ncbi:hypothetical protein Q9L58_006907 [Maublancomyces gigas]|uniref:Uncharacterized protein n=1 Tax=Discina gigas TaxID=1032678 RepID=A0ABR3GE35_9PEZI